MIQLRQLAMDWEQRADEDSAVATRQELVRDEFCAIAQTRRNCAWELRRVLSEMEKETPAEAGVSAPVTADRESVGGLSVALTRVKP